MPDKIEQYAQVRRALNAMGIPVSGGEHEYTRWGLKQLMDAQAVDVLQPDIYWCGGISETLKICAIASTYDLPVIPHGHSVYAAAHVVASQPPVTFPMAEYLVRYQPMAQHFHTHMLAPEGGAITLPTLPGLGIEIDPAKVTSRRDL
jgi:L-alanine-DL-glutamate epimerase-like enolase superfamily enzyme